jgi:U4/U6.U5 tri-snRNP-associated protein 1
LRTQIISKSGIYFRSKEERLNDTKQGGILDDNGGDGEILSWVGKSRKLDEKRQAEKEKALHRARALEEQVMV